jgi:hypothetical protein
MEKQYAIIKQNYVIDKITWDQQMYPDYVYPFTYDYIIEDINENINIGDWYESTENIFYRPLSTPPDLVIKG